METLSSIPLNGRVNWLQISPNDHGTIAKDKLLQVVTVAMFDLSRWGYRMACEGSMLWCWFSSRNVAIHWLTNTYIT